MSTLLHFARLLEAHNALANALYVHDSNGLLTMYRKPSGQWGLWLTDEWPASGPFAAQVSAAADEFEFTFHPIGASGSRMVMEIVLDPTLEELGSPIREALDTPPTT